MTRMDFGSSNRKTVVAGLLTVATVSGALWAGSALGAVGNDAKPKAEGFSTSVEVKAEGREAYATFGAEFPDDVQLPTVSDRIQELEDGSDGSAVFEDGYAESELVTIWRCGWQRSYLNAVHAGDKEAGTRAAGALSRYYDLDAVKKWVDDPDHLWYQEVIEPALKGDLVALEEDLSINCGAPFAP